MLRKVFVLLFFSSTVFASVQETPQYLHCVLSDMSRHRNIDEKSQSYEENKMVLFLLGTSDVVATVRDQQLGQMGERKLTAELSYNLGSTYGKAQTEKKYNFSDGQQKLINLQLQEPNEWGHILQLQCTLEVRGQ